MKKTSGFDASNLSFFLTIIGMVTVGLVGVGITIVNVVPSEGKAVFKLLDDHNEETVNVDLEGVFPGYENSYTLQVLSSKTMTANTSFVFSVNERSSLEDYLIFTCSYDDTQLFSDKVSNLFDNPVEMEVEYKESGSFTFNYKVSEDAPNETMNTIVDFNVKLSVDKA